MGFIAEIDAETAAGKPLESGSGGGDFPPLTKGKYQMTVRKVVKRDVFGGTGPNGQKPVLKLEVQIVEDSPTGKNRVYFPRVPLFTKFAPNEKHPTGAANLAFTGFWRDAMEWPEEKLRAGELPDENYILGRQFTGVLGAPKPPDQWNPLGSNEIDFYEKAGDVNATPTAPPRVPWLTAEGKLVEGYVAPVAGQAPAPQAYTPPPAPGAPAAPAYTPPSTPPAYTPPAAPGRDVWAPSPADVSYAQQQQQQQAA